MPGFTSFADMISQITSNGYEDIGFFEKTFGSGGANWISSWALAGMPAAGALPATTPGTAYTYPVTGALGFPAVSTKQRYGTSLSGITNSSSIMTICIADRLVAVSGLSLATATGVTVNSTTLPRYTSGTGVQAWLELTTALSTTAPIVQITYTDDSGTSGQVGSLMAASAVNLAINQMIGPLPLSPTSNDAGIQSVQTLTVSTASSTGVANLVLLKPLLYLTFPIDNWVERDLFLQSASMPRLFDGACLMVMGYNTASTPVTNLILRTAYE